MRPTFARLGTRFLTRCDRALEHLESALLAAGVLFLALLSIGNTLSRNLLGTTLPGVVELTEILMIWITFVGLAYAVRRARHISMSAVYDQVRGGVRKAWLVTVSLVTAALMLYLAWVAVEYVASVYDRGRVTTALRIPWWIVYVVVPAGLALAGIQYLLTAWRNLTSREIYRSFTERERYEEPAE